AKRVASGVGMVLRDLRVVVGPSRGGVAGALDPDEVARLLGLPLVGELPAEGALPAADGGGLPPGGAARGPLARFCAAFWERVPVAAAEGGGV
ncbi:septum formation initiator, partial [Streptomyces sp. NPDC000188]